LRLPSQWRSEGAGRPGRHFGKGGTLARAAKSTSAKILRASFFKSSKIFINFTSETLNTKSYRVLDSFTTPTQSRMFDLRPSPRLYASQRGGSKMGKSRPGRPKV